MKLTLLFIFLLAKTLLGQSLSGKITDQESGQPLAGCNISIAGTNRGTISNSEGLYLLDLPAGKYQIIFQFIGYKTDTLSIKIDNIDLKKDISLTAHPFISDKIVVFGGEYSKAEQLILRASREKKENLRLLQNYDCESYTKIAINGWADSLKNKYAMIQEAYSELVWNAPNDWHEIIKSVKTTANMPHSVSFFNGNSFLDINADRIQLGKKVIIGPTAPDAIDYYHYEILDTLFQDKRRIFKISIGPKENIRPLMRGVIFLVDQLFTIQKIDVHLNKSADFSFYEEIHLVQKYKPFSDKIYLPYYSFWQSAWIFGIPRFPKMRYQKTNFREDYHINRPKNQALKGITKIKINESMPFDSVKMYIPPLSQLEKKGYAHLDSLVSNVAIVKFMTASIKVVDFFAGLEKFPLGSFSNFYRFNRVEGNFLGVAYNSKKRLKPFELNVAYGYGLADKKPKFLFNPGWEFLIKKARMGVNFSLYDKINARDANPLLPVWYNTFRSIVDNLDYFDYYYSKGFEIAWMLKDNLFNFGIDLFKAKHTAAKRNEQYALFKSDKFLQNPLITNGHDVGFKLHAGYSTIAYKQNAFSRREIRNRPFIDFNLSFEQGLKEFEGDFEYQKLSADLYLRRNTFFKGFLDLTFLSAMASQGLPAQKWSELESGFEGYNRFKTFRTLEQNAFFGRNKAAVYLEHNFQNSLFQLSHIPFVEDLKYDFLLIYNGGWAGNKNFDKLSPKDLYQEAGFGIGRIFNFLQIDFIWRLQKAPYSHNFGFWIKVMEIEL